MKSLFITVKLRSVIHSSLMKAFLKKLAFPGWRYALAVLIVIAALGYFFFGRGGDQGATMVVTRGDFRQQVSVSGTVVAAKDADLGFAANGRIAGAYARVGQHVGAGAILAQIENGDLVAALAEAEADLAALKAGTRREEIAVASAAVASAEAALVDTVQDAYTVSDDAIHNKTDALFTNPRTADPKLTFSVSNATLKAAVERDRADIELVLASWALLVSKLTDANAADSAKQSQIYLARITTLLANTNAAVNQGVSDATITAATLSSYGTTLATARADGDDAAGALTSDSAELDSALKNLALKQAGSTPETIAAQQATVENAKATLVKTRVVAPFSGIVTRMDAKVGEIVSPNTSLIAMQGDGLFQIETFIPEVSIARVAVRNRATTTLDAYGSAAPFAAEVIAVDPAETIKDGVPTYKTTLTFLARDPRIRSGMTANVDIETGVLHDAIVIPRGAVGTKNGTPYVSVLDQGNVVERSVMTGPSPALGQVEILSGLSRGDIILLSPAP